jgi:hypothetical protein
MGRLRRSEQSFGSLYLFYFVNAGVRYTTESGGYFLFFTPHVGWLTVRG